MLQDMLADQCQLQAKQLKSRLGFTFSAGSGTSRLADSTMGTTPCHDRPSPTASKPELGSTSNVRTHIDPLPSQALLS